MKLSLLFCILFLSISPALAQRQWGIKVYTNIDRYEVATYDRPSGQETKATNTNFARLSLALHFHSRKKLAHEFEVTFSKTPASVSNGELPIPDYFINTVDATKIKTQTTSFAFRYEVNATLLTLSKIVALNLGVGLNPYRTTIDYSPMVVNYYQRINRFEGATLNVTPRVILKLSKRFTFDLNIPFNVYAVYRKTDDIGNPNIPINQRVNKEWFSRFFPNTYTLRCGILYLIKV